VATDILCDIEGTIGAITFVRDTLFPYARQHLPAFISEHADEPDVAACLADIARGQEFEASDTRAIIRLLERWIDEDRKETSLKALQGMLWARGYAAQDYRAHIYDDAERQLRRWKQRGHRLHIYSSGSVQAQKLYFRYSDHGDLRPLITAWFDTTSGPKQRRDSYVAISGVLGVPPAELLFISDAAAEVDAAQAAGLRTTLMLRPEDGAPEPASVHSRHDVAISFDEIRP
jgi:enolase-phosphatase E1